MFKKIKKYLIYSIIGKPVIFKTFKSYDLAARSGKYSYENSDLINITIEKTKAFCKQLKNNQNLNLKDMRTIFLIQLCKNKSKIKVLDFGGGTGNNYHIAKLFLGREVKVEWYVVETNKLVEAAKKNFLETKELKFYEDINNRDLINIDFDLIYCNSSIPYTNNPMYYLENLLAKNYKYLYLTRTPLGENLNRMVFGLQITKLSAFGPKSLSFNSKVKNKTIYIPFVVLVKEQVEDLISKYGIIKHTFIEELNVYQTDMGNFNNFGYVIEKKLKKT